MKLNPQRINAYIILGLIIVFVLYIITQYLNLRLAYKPLFDWWTQNGGKKYDDKLKIFNLVAAKKSAILFYISNSLFTPPLAKSSRGGIQFLLSVILPQALIVSSGGEQSGVITPRSLCESVLPDLDDGLDQKFIDWYKTGTRGNIRVNANCKTPLKYKQISVTVPRSDTGWSSGNTIFVYELDKDSISTYNNQDCVAIWPLSSDILGWKGLIFEWLNGESSTKRGKWADAATQTKSNGNGNPRSPYSPIWYIRTDSNHQLEIAQNGSKAPTSRGGQETDKFKHWFRTDPKTGLSHPPPDNWIARMGIRINSIFIAGFINDSYTLGGVYVDHKAFQILLNNTGGLAGGWVGFINGNPTSSDDYDNIIHTANEWNNPPTLKPCHHDWTSSIFSSIVTGLGIAVMGAMTGGWAAVGLVAAGAVAGGATFAQGATACS